MTIRTFIFDADPAARRRLAVSLAAESDFQILGDASPADLDLVAPLADQADVVFLDPAGAPDLPASFSAKPAPAPLLVFVSADREHLASAFEHGAVDFVLKPAVRRRWHTALDRVRHRLAERAARDSAPSAPAAPAPLKRVTVRLADRLLVVDVADIDWIESANNYMVLHVGRDTHIVRETMTRLEERLPADRFVRVSRSAIVNVTRVREITLEPDGGHCLQLAGGASVPLTRGIRELQRHLESA